MDLNALYEQLVAYGGKIVLALVVLLAGMIAIKYFLKFLRISFEKKNLDVSLRPFLLSLTKVTLMILLFITVASMLGAQMTSFIAVLGSAGLAIGLALQGSLSNFAGGVLILILKPFKVGDYIEAAGYSGTVEEIQMFYTILVTPDNKKIIVPNSNMSNSGTVNYSSKPTRRVDFVFGVGYEADIFKVKNILKEIAANDPLVLNDPEPQIVLGEHDASSINFYYRVWCESKDYWTIYFETMEKVKIAFDEEGISIPFPQMDVHVVNQ
ncbi:mechanosensitive ion channel family protein [Alkalibacter mobilis]|uniref:mechanosensitive ion channel family protein n=1 Tax=Alkalibacter mobilis TaxID=2787712 RepID=UPI00189E8C07|nr:mechanosensitive ion channel domain-containing protein [Alkalibacter mobilis]MBF7096208.1 mechanosensitive ion channel [Alkalibacter mobilis]